MLLRSTDPETRLKACYHLARSYELRKEYRKALFYARAARQHSTEVQQQLWEAASLNQTGNLLLAETQLPAALEAYEQALGAMPAEIRCGRRGSSTTWATAASCRGGCTRASRSSCAACGPCAAWARGDSKSPRASICASPISRPGATTGRPSTAKSHSLLAEEFSDADSLKNALVPAW